MARRKKEEQPKADTPEVTDAKVGSDGETAPEEAPEAVEETKADDSAGADAETIEEEAAVEEEPTLEDQLELARQEAGQNLEGWQRAAAELANYKRRQEEQLKLQRDRIKGEVLEGILSALDDMDLAFQNVPEEIDGQLVGWVEGFRLVQRKLHKVLDEQNVMPINTEGQFDPNFHEAVSYEESEEHEEGEIIGELRKGYQIGSRVLRPALVRVAK
jgi:molecular chaperone GrpE